MGTVSYSGSRSQFFHKLLLVSSISLLSLLVSFFLISPTTPVHVVRRNGVLQAKCNAIRAPAGPPPTYDPSTRIDKGSDRHVAGTPPTLLRNAKILTGARNGTEIVFGDVLLDKGVVVAVGYIRPSLLDNLNSDLTVVDVQGKWISPGLVDMHSHIGVHSVPGLSGEFILFTSWNTIVIVGVGASDGNSRKAPILPWLRSIDGLNTHDASYELAVAGGVTTVQVLPGSANNIGQSYPSPSCAFN